MRRVCRHNSSIYMHCGFLFRNKDREIRGFQISKGKESGEVLCLERWELGSVFWIIFFSISNFFLTVFDIQLKIWFNIDNF